MMKFRKGGNKSGTGDLDDDFLGFCDEFAGISGGGRFCGDLCGLQIVGGEGKGKRRWLTGR